MFFDQVQKLCAEKGISVTKLAEELGLSGDSCTLLVEANRDLSRCNSCTSMVEADHIPARCNDPQPFRMKISIDIQGYRHNK